MYFHRSGVPLISIGVLAAPILANQRGDKPFVRSGRRQTVVAPISTNQSPDQPFVRTDPNMAAPGGVEGCKGCVLFV